MAISCNCDWDGEGISAVGDPREVTCRTPGKCYACQKAINIGDRKYQWSMYDYEECQTSAPITLCEECGDMALNVMELGFCFSFSRSIREQWLEYLEEHGRTPKERAAKTRRRKRREARDGIRYRGRMEVKFAGRQCFIGHLSTDAGGNGFVTLYGPSIGDFGFKELEGASPALVGLE